MKRRIVFTICLIISLFLGKVFSQSKIIKYDKTQIEANILEIDTEVVKYRPEEFKKGPIRNIEIKDVFMIIHSNGEVETFTSIENSQPEKKDSSLIQKLRMDEVVLKIVDKRDSPITLLGDKFVEQGKFIHLNARNKDNKNRLFKKIATIFHEEFLSNQIIFYGNEGNAPFCFIIYVNHLSYGGESPRFWQKCSVSVELINSDTEQKIFDFEVSDVHNEKINFISFDKLVSGTIGNVVNRIIEREKFRKSFIII